MKRSALVLFVLVLALPIAAAEYEKLLLPVAPSVVFCGYHSKFDTRLVAFNGHDRPVDKFCSDDMCQGLAPSTGTVLVGQHVPVPNPSFIYVPKEDAKNLSMMLIAESSETTRPEERSYTELPVVRESDFRSDRIQIVGVRMDPDFRKTLRIYGLDGSQWIAVRVRVYDLTSAQPKYEHEYALGPIAGKNAAGLDAAPSFNMECDLSDYVPSYGTPVRVEVEPLTPGAKIWAFVSVTNNVTQHFYTVLPR